MRRTLLVPIAAVAIILAGAVGARAASEVACGYVQDVRPATTTTPGSFALVAGQPTTVTIRPGETGLFAGYICIDAEIVNSQWVFVRFIGPADPRFISQIPQVVCGTLSPNTQTNGPRSGPDWVELRNAQGWFSLIDPTGVSRLNVPAHLRPAMGTYVCARVGVAGAFQEFVAPGAEGYIAPPRLGSLPSTSTVRIDTTLFAP